MQSLGSGKAPDAFRTISEVAEDLDIPQHVLRFWETKFTAIRPLKRAGGRRYYRPDDVDLLKGIRTLLYGKGYTIKGVQRILKEDGPRVIQQVGRDGLGAQPSQPPSSEPVLDRDGTGERLHEHGTLAPDPSGPIMAWEKQVEEYAEDAAPRSHQGAEGLGRLSVERLRSVLADLHECRRILQATRTG